MGSHGGRSLPVRSDSHLASGFCAFVWPCSLSQLRALGVHACGSGFRVQGAGCRVQGAGFRVQGSKVVDLDCVGAIRPCCVGEEAGADADLLRVVVLLVVAVTILVVGAVAHAFLFREREFFIDNLLVRIHLIIVMISVDRPCAMGV